MADTEETTSEVHPNQRRGVATDDREKRIERIDELVFEGIATQKIARLISSEFGIAVRTAYEDIREAAERRAPDEEAARLTLQERAAAHWKYREQVAEKAGKHADANYAFDRWCKVKGAFSPKKVEITGSIGVVAVQMRAVIAVLDADGRKALELVMKQLEAAKAAGKLIEPDPPKTLKP